MQRTQQPLDGMTILHSFFISLYIRTTYKTGSWNLLSTHPFLSVFNVLWTPLVVWKKTAHKNPSKTATVTNKTDHTFSIFSSPTQAHKFFLVTRVSALATNWQSVQKKKNGCLRKIYSSQSSKSYQFHWIINFVLFFAWLLSEELDQKHWSLSRVEGIFSSPFQLQYPISPKGSLSWHPMAVNRLWNFTPFPCFLLINK